MGKVNPPSAMCNYLPFLSSGAKVFNRSFAPLPPRWRTVERTRRVRCLKCNGGQEVERRVGYSKIEEDEEWNEMRKWAAEKCMGELGMVEMLECLEKEAIVCKDSGKEPTNYDRRARSKVFQALRDEEEEQHHRPSA